MWLHPSLLRLCRLSSNLNSPRHLALRHLHALVRLHRPQHALLRLLRLRHLLHAFALLLLAVDSHIALLLRLSVVALAL